jgi:uncharacterized protein YndB with AHSA1/START domain
MRVEVTIHIKRSVEDVFAYITNFENNPKWQNGMVYCTFTTPPPLSVGSPYKQMAQFMRRSIESQFEVTKLIPNQRVEFETIESTFPIQIVREVSSTVNGTQLHAIISGQPSGLMRLFSPLMKSMMSRQI